MSHRNQTNESPSYEHKMNTPLSAPFSRNFYSSSSSSTSNYSSNYPSDVMGSRNEISLYEPIRTIGSGSFGKIMRIRRRCDQAKLVWKELEVTNMNSFEKNQVDTEINLLRALSVKEHPNIVKYHDSFSNIMGKTFIVMEYCENGDLATYIESHRRNGTWTSESFIWKILGQISSALKACHRHQNIEKNTYSTILHRDVKPANILLDRYMNAKLCDFGLATELYPDPSPVPIRRHSHSGYDNAPGPFVCSNIKDNDDDDGMCGTPFYMAPERVNRCRYDERSDIWSLGCIIYEMTALRHPFMSENEIELASKINSGLLARLPSHYSTDLQSTCKWMLRRDVEKRPTVDDICRLPQIQATLSEISLRIQQIELENRISGFEHEMSHRKRKMEEKEKYLMSLESMLIERENKLRERENRMGAWEQNSHPRPVQGLAVNYESLHIPHLIDDTPRDYSAQESRDRYSSEHLTHSPSLHKYSHLPQPRPRHMSHEPDQQHEVHTRRRNYNHVSKMNPRCTSPRTDHPLKRLRMTRCITSSPDHTNLISMSPNFHCPAVSYEDYYFRRSHS